MKVSQEKKQEIRKKLIDTAVELFIKKGFSSATMREISTGAGFGTATIYNYFPNKEKILYAYFYEKQKEVNETLEKIPDYPDFHLKEKLQIQLETLLDLYLGEREFVREAFKLVFDSPLRTFTEFQPVKNIFTETVEAAFSSAIESGEIPEQPFQKFLVNLYWDYTSLIILYWMRDDSEGFTQTSCIIDMSLEIIVEVLKSGLVTKGADILAFLFKSHLYNNVEKLSSLFDSAKSIREQLKDSLKKGSETEGGR
jgi:AcrR family transcriptional regulator